MTDRDRQKGGEGERVTERRTRRRKDVEKWKRKARTPERSGAQERQWRWRNKRNTLRGREERPFVMPSPTQVNPWQLDEPSNSYS